MNRNVFILLIAFATVACSHYTTYTTDIEQVLKLAGNNRKELEKVLEHYRRHPGDSLKYRAAVFLIENMQGHLSVNYPETEEYYRQIRSIFAVENKTRSQADSLFQLIKVNHRKTKSAYDIQTMRASYLTNQIEQAFETRNYPWTQSIPWEDFCEYVLPYRNTQEPIEDWRPLYKQRMVMLLDSLITVQASDSLVCATLMSFFKPEAFVLVENGFPVPLKPSMYLDMNTGSCKDLTFLSQYVMRVAGLPVTYDFTPQWANRILGHEWNAVISKGEAITFQIGDDVPFGEHLRSKSEDKLAKAYRRMFSLQKENLLLQHPKRFLSVTVRFV